MTAIFISLHDQAVRQDLRGGWALDVAHVCKVTGRKWDCLDAGDRAWCKRMLRRDQPQLLVASPLCTLFSQLQNLSPNGLPPVRCPVERENAKLMVDFAVELCLIQTHAGRAFVFEQPRTATSWEVVEKVKDLFNDPSVEESILDMCCFDMTSVDNDGERVQGVSQEKACKG